MLKTISAALVAVSVLAAPAFAGTPGKTAQAPVNKITQAPVVKAEQGKAKLLNANARMGRHHTSIIGIIATTSTSACTRRMRSTSRSST